MNFGAVLHTAQRNEKVVKKDSVRCYSTKFEPPKKEQRNKQQLSQNIKKFLARKEAEEQKKQMDAHRKKEDLMALRAKDKKATRTMNVMLKRTKSANKSVIGDAVDSNNTSVTLAGPIQPDEDDYGYVSQEASAFYNKMMEKYSKMPEEPKFSSNKKKKVSTDLNSTKERVKAALEREQEEANSPHKRKRKHKEVPSEEPLVEEQPEEIPKVKVKAAPPPSLNFNDLLKLAAKKQFEPITIEQKPKEEERLFTKKQKKEMEREKEWRDRRSGKLPPLEKPNMNKPANDKDKIPNMNANMKREVNKIDTMKKYMDDKKVPEINKNISLDKSVGLNQHKPTQNVPLQSVKPKVLHDVKKKDVLKTPNKSKMPQSSDLRLEQDLKRKQFPPPDVIRKQFLPGDVKPDLIRKQFPPRDVKRKPLINKRRILDDEDEYDSEMDDFIDDGHGESEDYSKYISEIFGYDKSRYKQHDDDVDNMESSFAQQMREEVISTKIGIMEDLEDMKMEEEQKRRKALMKKGK